MHLYYVKDHCGVRYGGFISRHQAEKFARQHVPHSTIIQE